MLQHDKFSSLVTVICVTFDSAAVVDTLAHTLASFDSVILVDNNSRDATVEKLRSGVPHAELMALERNIGFGPANNRALSKVATPFALLLNPDCVIDAIALNRLLEVAGQFPGAAILAPQAYRADGATQPAYRNAFFEHAPAAYQVPDGITSAKWLHGCCLLVRMDHIRSRGGFDERFFLYYEDDDLCLQALAAGRECLVVPDATVMHLGGASSEPKLRTDLLKSFQFGRSRRLILGKYLGPSTALKYRLKILAAAPLAIVIYGLTLQRRHLVKWLGWGAAALMK